MKLPAWTKKVFAPVFSTSTSTSTSDTPPTAAFTSFTPSTTNGDLSKSKGSIQSYLSFSTLPAVKKRIHFHDVSETNTNANPTSTSSLMNALFFSHIRDPRTTASSSEMSKPSGQLQDSEPALVVDIQKSNKNDTNDDGEGDDESYHDLDSPVTTTIYYHPPSPRESPETSPFPSPTSDTVNGPLTAKSDHKLWCLRHHIGLLPSASASSPEFHHLRQHYHHLHHHHMYHDKDCEFARRSAVEPGQRHATAQHRKKQEEGLSPMSPLPSTSSVPKIKSVMASVLPYCPPTRFEVRRSSANYSLEALKNEKRNNCRSSSRASVSTSASTSRNSSTSNLISSSPRRHVHSEETIRELRESIKCMSHFGFAPFSSPLSSASKKSVSSKVQIAPKAAPTVAVSNSGALTTRTTVTAPASRVRPPGPRNSPLASRSIKVSTPDAAATTTTTTTVTTTTTAPVSANINGYEQLIQKVDTLAREVEIMKQQRPYTLTSTAVATTNNNNNTGSSVAANSDTPIQAFRTITSRRNPSTVSLPLPTIMENSTEPSSSVTTSIATTHSDDATSIAPPLTNDDWPDRTTKTPAETSTAGRYGYERDSGFDGF
ncbi:hypothetical protein KI688_012932 [Linnemannia hyalina]|uniref:Uncharacterized protein n=1 Tax=Linnemannia hyalina TaxID=64524 RepID=A0A9P7XTF4_9FUNG|nr:hypothetical protein KI688_012932 [Linnemannia hyalina]